jgi:uncharacterized membrane protein
VSPRLSAADRAIGLIPWIIAALFGGIGLHLLAVLSLPALAPGAPFRKLALPLEPGERAFLPRAEAISGGSAFADPFAALALCRFDLARGPLRVRAAADGDRPTSISVRLADGTIIYSANDKQTPNGKFNVLVVTQAQADALDSAQDNSEQTGAGGGATDELRLVSPGARGFVLFRTLALREGDYEAAAAARGGFACATEKPAP